ncbi:MAG: ABC transporter permease [Rhodoferax sp.]
MGKRGGDVHTLFLAWRNLLRHRRRSLATLLAMATGLCATLVFGGYAANAIYALETGYVQLHGHLQIQRQGYQAFGSANPAAYGVADYGRIQQALREDAELAPLLTVVTPKLMLSGIAGQFASGVSTQVVAAAVLPQDQAQLRAWDGYGGLNYAQPMPLLDTPEDAVVLGTGLARRLQLCAPLGLQDCPALPAQERTGASAPQDIADLSTLAAQESGSAARAGDAARLELLAASAGGAPNVASLRAVAAQNWGLKEFDDSYALMHLPQAQRLVYGTAAPQVSAIQVQLRHSTDLPAARARIQALLAQQFPQQALELLDFATLAPIYGQTIEFFDSVFGFIATLIGVIVLFTVGNTMGMAVVERTVEIGTLRAIGLRQSGIRRLFVCEGLLLGLGGALLGAVAALLVAALINASGLSWAPPGYVYAYPLTVRVWGAWHLVLPCMLALVLVAVGSAWWPARRAARLDVVEALRHA